MKNTFSLLFVSFILAACGGSTTSDNGCKMGAPQAMFEESLEGISAHSFHITQNNSTEEFTFGGNPVAIYQSGCDQVTQEFQFSFSNKTTGDKEAMYKIADILTAWSKLGKKQALFASWAEQIRLVSIEMHLGESFSPTPDIEIALDRVNQSDGEILTLTLNQKG